MNTVNLNRTMNTSSIKQTSGIIISINKWMNKQAELFEETRFGMMAMYIIIQSCLGSIACMYILQNNAPIWQLSSCAAITMASNSVFIAQGTAKWCLGIFYLSIVTNAVFVFINI